MASSIHSTVDESAKFWLDPQLDHLELLRATYFTFAFAPHAHDTYAIGVTEAGAQTFTHQRSKHWIMPAGSVAVVHPGEVHTSQATNDQGWSYRMMYPKADTLRQIGSELAGTSCDFPTFNAPVFPDENLARQISNFHHTLEDPQTTRLERESGLHWVLGGLISRYAADPILPCPAPPEPFYIRRVSQYLEEHYADQVSLEELAQLVGMSGFHMLRVFRNTTGFTPHAYQMHLRIEHAKQLLIQGMSLAATAAETGFVDQSHLTRQFKRAVGISPGQYR